MDGAPKKLGELGGRKHVPAEELTRRKGVKPITSLEDFEKMRIPGFFKSDEEMYEFIRLVREWRNADLA
jgi:hypothetical protein